MTGDIEDSKWHDLSQAIVELEWEISDSDDAGVVDGALDVVASAFISSGLATEEELEEADSLSTVLSVLAQKQITPNELTSLAEALEEQLEHNEYGTFPDENLGAAESAREELYSALAAWIERSSRQTE